MSYFSRLSDIVTCNLSALLVDSDDPVATLTEIINEMQQGISGARRSVSTARDNVARIESEISEQRRTIDDWMDQARAALSDGDEETARRHLLRKREVEDLIAGLEQQLSAATATRNHLQTMLSALEARLHDARRRLTALEAGQSAIDAVSGDGSAAVGDVGDDSRLRDVEAELDALRRELQ
ncbi:MAG: PspA/IM30 family protein [Maioricimonas sp. JB045]|uniref:PspA/IM30 family protein n=1 Tax=Maioricimonas sp. JC845 TaxID=3232138 RepID=UPI003457CA33